MRLVVRWVIAILTSAIVSAGAWYGCRYLGRLDAGTCWAITGIVATVVVAVAASWAIRSPPTPNALGPGAAVTEGDHSPAVTGNNNVIITGKVRNATIHNADPDRHRPLAPAASPTGGLVITGDIPQRPTAFQPRDTALARRHEPDAGVSVIYAVTGMRGTGKTQLAAAVAHQCITDRWRLIAWVNASTPATTLDGLAAAATAAGIAARNDQRAAAEALRHWLEADGRQCLLVLDNADDPDTLRPFLPAAGQAQVLVTSTSQAMTSMGTPVPVDVYTPAEALAYLIQRTGRHDDQGAAELADELGHLPLALAQAAAVIVSQGLTYPAYLDRLRTFPVEQYLTRRAGDPYPHSTAAVILLALQAACATDPTGLAAALMDLIAVLAPAGVPRSLLYIAATTTALTRAQIAGHQQGAPAQAVTLAAVDAALGHLADSSVVTFSLDEDTVNAHRLTSRVLREQHQCDATLAAAGTIAVTVLDTATGAAEPAWQHADTARDLIQQIIALHEHLASALEGNPGGITVGLLRLQRWALRCLNELGDSTAQAIELGQALTAETEWVLGADHPDTLSSQHDLASAYWSAGRLDQAIALFERTLADREQVLGADHPDTLSSQHDLASAYQAAGRLDQAIALFERTLADREQVLGADHPDTLSSQHDLASAYQAAGRLGHAIALYDSTRAGRERVLGADHPDTVTSWHGLAGAYLAAGWLDQAIAIYERTLADRERVLGADHLDTLISRYDLAFAYQAAGRLDQAIALFERTLADRERVLGADHLHTLTSRHGLAFAYQAAGRLAEAISLFERTLAGRERVLGADHLQTLACRNNLASAYQAAGRLDQAIALSERTLADCERALGADHSFTLTSRNDLAYTYSKAGRLDQAIAQLEHALADCERVLGPHHPQSVATRRALASLHRKARWLRRVRLNRRVASGSQTTPQLPRS